MDEARKFLECSRNENDQLYPLWVLILVLGLRKGEALGLIEPDDGWQFTDEDTAVIDLEWQLQRVGGATRSPTSRFSRPTAAPTRCRCRRYASPRCGSPSGTKIAACAA